MLETIIQTTQYIKDRITHIPSIAIILGSGLGNLGNEIDIEEVFDYSEIPNFPISTVEGHKGKLLFGKLNGTNVLIMQGRFHYYEGYNMKTLTFPIRVMQQLGIKYLLLSNAAGALNPEFKVGDIMMLTDHINKFYTNPLIGNNDESLGERFPEMSEPYDKTIRQAVLDIAKKQHIELRQGVYLGLSGPMYETPAECRYYRMIGGDAVGMSTIPEVIVARHAHIKVAAFSVITNCCNIEKTEIISHNDVQKYANEAEPRLKTIITELVNQLESCLKENVQK